MVIFELSLGQEGVPKPFAKSCTGYNAFITTTNHHNIWHPTNLRSTIYCSSSPVAGVQPGSKFPNRDSRSGANKRLPGVVRVPGGSGSITFASSSASPSSPSSSPGMRAALSLGAMSAAVVVEVSMEGAESDDEMALIGGESCVVSDGLASAPEIRCSLIRTIKPSVRCVHEILPGT